MCLKSIGTVKSITNMNELNRIKELNNLLGEGKSKYQQVKDSINRSKSIDKEMKEKIIGYITSGSRYAEGGRVYGLSKPNELRDKSNKVNGVSMGADKNGFFVYTHRARSKSYSEPGKIPVKDIEFIESTG